MRRLVNRRARSSASTARVFRPAGQVLGPIVHEQPPPLEQVRPRVGRLHLVLHHVRERRLDDLARVVRLLR